jgi:FMN reductase
VRAIAISGSPGAHSKSRALAEQMLRGFKQHDIETALIDVSRLPAEALLGRGQAVEIERAVEAVGAAHIVVAATPTYRALYAGALKCLFDLMPQGHLRGKVCIPLQTGAVAEHWLSPQYGLQALFASLEGVAIAGIYATDDEFSDGQPGGALDKRIGDVAMAAYTLARAIHGR